MANRLDSRVLRMVALRVRIANMQLSRIIFWSLYIALYFSMISHDWNYEDV